MRKKAKNWLTDVHNVLSLVAVDFDGRSDGGDDFDFAIDGF